jgi:hypothetical protein
MDELKKEIQNLFDDLKAISKRRRACAEKMAAIDSQNKDWHDNAQDLDKVIKTHAQELTKLSRLKQQLQSMTTPPPPAASSIADSMAVMSDVQELLARVGTMTSRMKGVKK